ncbi:endo alpha-1,4 polygalactosaminidase [Sinomonas sp. ASV322]|uniref:endo alpha-1,4 polygalactosaminidase n=1 Tax=Sinomonas sp. ASV322 TaxID=3041920 RepID=UPI0027DC071C|nr:endo alpha-1,4 polygalactosaminidase [Sinomonas sp. ASV322]MDQ4501591.1 endo alpha-1,4 polygalactosaminidase [Sinomonas sp. ASV322]
MRAVPGVVVVGLLALGAATACSGGGSPAPGESAPPAARDSGGAQTPASPAPAPTSAYPAPAQTPASPAPARLPPTAGGLSYQLGGAYPPSSGVAIVIRDRKESPAPGLYSICYVNAFQAQPGETAWWSENHPELLLRDPRGSLVIDPQWNEPLLNLDTDAARRALAEMVGGWIDGCARDGFSAIEADNFDSFSRSRGLLSEADALAYGRMLAERAHRAGLVIAQKNASELSSQARAVGFDFAVAEECGALSECGAYVDVYGSQVLDIEYTDEPESAFIRACHDFGTRIQITRRDRNLVPVGQPGHHEQWCDARS